MQDRRPPWTYVFAESYACPRGQCVLLRLNAPALRIGKLGTLVSYALLYRQLEVGKLYDWRVTFLRVAPVQEIFEVLMAVVKFRAALAVQELKDVVDFGV